MNEKENKNRRDLYLKIRVNQEELDAIDRKLKNICGRSKVKSNRRKESGIPFAFI